MRLKKQEENKLKMMNKVKKINLDDLLYTNPNKIKPIKEEYDKEDDSYKNDPHKKKKREKV